MKLLNSIPVQLTTAGFIFVLFSQNVVGETVVRNSKELVAAVQNEPAGSVITICGGNLRTRSPA